MGKITDYPRVDHLEKNDVFLIDGPNGTRQIDADKVGTGGGSGSGGNTVTLTKTLPAGETELVFEDESITEDRIFQFYGPWQITIDEKPIITDGSIILTIPKQEEDVEISVKFEPRDEKVASMNAQITEIKEEVDNIKKTGHLPIINNLTTEESGVGVLDAYQGKVLNDRLGVDIKLIDGVPNWSPRGADTWSPFKNGDFDDTNSLEHIISLKGGKTYNYNDTQKTTLTAGKYLIIDSVISNPKISYLTIEPEDINAILIGDFYYSYENTTYVRNYIYFLELSEEKEISFKVYMPSGGNHISQICSIFKYLNSDVLTIPTFIEGFEIGSGGSKSVDVINKGIYLLCSVSCGQGGYGVYQNSPNINDTSVKITDIYYDTYNSNINTCGLETVNITQIKTNEEDCAFNYRQGSGYNSTSYMRTSNILIKLLED